MDIEDAYASCCIIAKRISMTNGAAQQLLTILYYNTSVTSLDLDATETGKN